MNAMLCFIRCIIVNLFFVTLAFGQTQVRLVGIYNNFISPVRVQVRGGALAEGTPFSCLEKLPVDIDITKGEKTYTIRIAESKDRSCTGHTIGVEAKVVGYGDKYIQKTCVPTAIAPFLYGKKVFGWQSVILLLKDNPKFVPGSTENIPFEFAISAWTSTKDPWNKKSIAHPTSQMVLPSKKRTITFDPPINVSRGQGQAAWGGGNIPRLGFGNIVHVYNNTPYMIMIDRMYPHGSNLELAKYNFSKRLISPHTVIPYAMIWIPKIDPDKVMISQKPEIALYILKVSEKKNVPPPPNFGLIGTVGTTEVEVVTPGDIEEKVNEIMSSLTAESFSIMGEPTIVNFMKSPYDQYFIGNNFYKIFTTTDKAATTYIQNVPLDKEEDAETILKTPGSFDGINPRYFSLIINEKNGKITFNLIKIKFVEPY